MTEGERLPMMTQEICSCCGRGGRGFLEAAPNVWTGCRCLGIRRCADCSLCYEHCLCVPHGERMAALEREEESAKALVEEARQLAIALGVDEMHGRLTEGTMWKIEQLLSARHRAFRRFRRRIGRVIDVDINRQSVERASSSDVITVESDRPS